MSRRQHSPAVHDPSVGTNRREVLLGAGGFAAVAAMGAQPKDRETLPAVQLTGSIDGIGQFEVIDLSTGATTADIGSLGGGAGSGKVNFQDFQFTKVTDSTSPMLLLACATGQHIKSASFTFATRRGSPAIRYDLDDVLVSSFGIEENTLDRPTETITITYGKIRITVDGATAGWDLGKNTSI
jgi:type VI secretion system secreted protein Hcp